MDLIRSKALEKYLARYAEPTAARGAEVSGRYRHVVVVPAAGEGEGLDRAVASIPTACGGAVLAVVVINQRVDCDSEVRRLNDEAAARLDGLYPGGVAPFGRVVVLREELPAKQGVGLARKLACDFALGAHAAGRIETGWIHCTDADVVLPTDYFDGVGELSGSALVYPFEHTRHSDAAADEAILRYEIMLRHYVLGLRSAGSPYGFHMIGSCMAVDVESYAKVRGFPKLAAAEDFYLLGKLAKVGPVVRARSGNIVLSSRGSTRVPFGTGRAVRDGSAGAPRGCYAPACFALLGELLAQMERLPPRLDLRDERLARAAAGIGLLEIYEETVNSRDSRERKSRRLREWFDAFRTRKLIHALRDEGLSDQSAEQALPASPFLRTKPLSSGLRARCAALAEDEISLGSSQTVEAGRNLPRATGP